jgi:hypothetical protein
MDFPDLPPRTAQRRTKRRSPFGPLLHISITAASVVVAILILGPRLATKTPETATTTVRVTPRRRPTRPVATPSLSPPVEREPEPQRDVEPPPPPEPTHHLDELPRAVTLPTIDDREIAVLANVIGDVAISLLTNSEELALNGTRVVLNGVTVAGVRCSEGRVEFRWVESSGEAAAALSRSLLMLTIGEERKAIALSEPTKLSAEPIGLKNRLIRLKYECDERTPIENIRCEIAAELPDHTASGDSVQAMSIGDEALITYPFADEVKVDTNVRAWKSGDAMMVDLDSRFQLPSGYEKPLTISEGALRLKKLDSLLVELRERAMRVAAAQDNLSASLDALRYAESLPVRAPGGSGTSSILVGTRARAINAAERRVFRAEEELAYLADLGANEKMIERDHEAINAIAAWSHLVREIPLRYRFYVLVGGEQLDLVVAE